MILWFLILVSFVGTIYASDTESDVECLGAGVGKALRKPEVYEDNSDREGAVFDREAFGPVKLEKQPGTFSSSIVQMGIRVKLLANVYLRNIDEKANIFVPFFRAIIKKPDGSIVEKANYFRYKRKMCVFASGGFHNAWEKSTQRVYKAFYGTKIKIIRGSWIQKHLYGDYKESVKFERTPLEHLHSELYYKTFFEKFYPSQLDELKEGGEVLGIVIDAFSWWDVCDGCHEHNLPRKLEGIPVTYRIKSARSYKKAYHDSDTFQSRVLVDSKKRENDQWLSLWEKIKELPKKELSEDDKRAYWTGTLEGIELTKWLGQAFVENKIPGKKGDVLRHYQALEAGDKTQLETLIDYLKEENWEFSCWYSGKDTIFGIQKTWNTYCLKLVMPHFGWAFISDVDAAVGINCQMCGRSEIKDVRLVYHPKYLSAKEDSQRGKIIKFVRDESFADQEEDSEGEEPSKPVKKISQDPSRAFKMKSLAVGSSCFSTLRFTKEQIIAARAPKGPPASSYKTPSRKKGPSSVKKRAAEIDEVENDSDSSVFDDDRKKIVKAPAIKRPTKQRRVIETSDEEGV